MDGKWNTVKTCLMRLLDTYISGSVRMIWEDFGLSECKGKLIETRWLFIIMKFCNASSLMWLAVCRDTLLLVHVP